MWDVRHEQSRWSATNLCLTGRGESKRDDVLGKAAKRPHTPLDEKHEQILAGQFGSMFCCSGRWKRDRERHPLMYALMSPSSRLYVTRTGNKVPHLMPQDKRQLVAVAS